MEEVDAVSGRLAHISSNASNDVAVRLFILFLFLGWISAKSRAKLINLRSYSCEFQASNFFHPSRQIPHHHGPSRLSGSLSPSANTITSPQIERESDFGEAQHGDVPRGNTGAVVQRTPF